MRRTGRGNGESKSLKDWKQNEDQARGCDERSQDDHWAEKTDAAPGVRILNHGSYSDMVEFAKTTFPDALDWRRRD